VKSPTVGRGRGAGSRRGSGRGRAKKRVHHSEDNASEEEKYIPRSSKRRAAVAAVSRMKQPSDYEDDDFDDVLPARPVPVAKPATKTSPATKTGRPRGRPPLSAGRGQKPVHVSGDDNSDAGQNNVDDYDSSEESPPKKKRASGKAKPTCQYGKDCYRLVQNCLTISPVLSFAFPPVCTCLLITSFILTKGFQCFSAVGWVTEEYLKNLMQYLQKSKPL